MQIFNCKVRLNGNVLHEVPRLEVSAAEVILLQHIHGNDAVVGLKHINDDQRTNSFERNRLAEIYGEKRVKEVFGLSSLPLPAELSGFDGEDEEPEAEPARPRRQRRAEPLPADHLS